MTAVTWLGIGMLIGWAMGAIHATAHLSRIGRLRPKPPQS